MLKVLREDSTRETELSGTRSELLALGQWLRSGQGEMSAATVANPYPYGRSLPRIGLRRADGKVRIAPSGDGESLEIQGGAQALALLADNVEGFALEADQDDHLHVDYFPDHDYLADGSDSLVIGMDADAPRSS
ncbi:Imm32 family immunity protein [Streptomyces pristinaespiralis]|uniref:Imm32 family immunity protein n=1 Tax=Streptomyces pristinaespiralis TaxID=38300 RepID=UPI0038395B98